MALDGVSEHEVEAVTLQDVPVTMVNLATLVQLAAEADVIDTVLILTLTKLDGDAKPILEVMFAGNPWHLPKMLEVAERPVQELAKDSKQVIAREEFLASGDPWDQR